jgi:hypothetical protein
MEESIEMGIEAMKRSKEDKKMEAEIGVIDKKGFRKINKKI